MAVGTRRIVHDNFNERVCALTPFKVQKPDRKPCSRSTRITTRANNTVGKVSTDKSVQNFSRYWVVLSTSSTDAF